MGGTWFSKESLSLNYIDAYLLFGLRISQQIQYAKKVKGIEFLETTFITEIVSSLMWYKLKNCFRNYGNGKKQVLLFSLSYPDVKKKIFTH